MRLQLIGFDVASGEAFATVGAQDVDGNARLDASVLSTSACLHHCAGITDAETPLSIIIG